MRENFFPFSSSEASRKEFMEVERIESLQELIAGIIHELNDPLSAILGFSEVLQSMDTDPEIKKYVSNIHIAAVKSARIIEGLLNFMRKREAEFTIVTINEVIKQTVSLFEYQLRTRDIALSLRLSPGMLQIKGDFYKLQQVFFNLLMNSFQAFEEWSGDRRISISSELRRDGMIRVTVSDTGPGISAENIGKVFTPFFSTKPKGTGLGLSIVYGIIKEHGGRISPVQEGKGCTFVLDFPPTSESVRTPAESGHTALKIKKRVLIVDDDELVVNAMGRITGIIGCDVVFTTAASNALDELKKGEFDLVFVDYKMSDMDGIDFIEKASGFMDTKKFVIITGDTTLNADEVRQKYGIPILWKPFGLREFRKVIASHA